MHTSSFRMSWAAVGLVAVAMSTSAAVNIPIISGRTYVSESAKFTVTGSFQINEDIAATPADGSVRNFRSTVCADETDRLPARRR